MLKIFPRVLRGIFYIKHFLYAKKCDIIIGIERRDYMPKILLSVSLILFGLTPVLTQAAPVGRHFESNELDVTAVIPGTEGMSEMEVIATLKHDIDVLDEELRQCERKRKGWVAATVVGGVGVVGTGIAALVQNSKIQDKKAELKRVEGDVASAKEDVNRAQERLDKMQ
jgi:hypothetical protein